jgi:hypothetical protein
MLLAIAASFVDAGGAYAREFPVSMFRLVPTGGTNVLARCRAMKYVCHLMRYPQVRAY